MKINFFINGFSKPFLMFLNTLKKDHIKKLFWIHHNNSEKNIISQNFNNVLCMNNYDLCKTKFYSINSNELKIPSGLIKVINSEMSIIVDMISRFEGYNSFSNNDKITYIFLQVNYWYNFLKKNEINCYMQFDTPHDVYDYIIYLISKYMNLNIIILQQSSFFIKNDKNIEIVRILTSTNDLISGQATFQKVFEENQNKYQFEKIKSAYDLSKKNSAFAHRNKLTNPKKKNTITKFLNFIKNENLSNNYAILNLNNITKDISILNFKKFRYKVHKKTDELKKYLFRCSIDLNELNNKFIYFPLQYQPERTSCPEGRDYSNQYLLIAKLRSYLDPKISIIVKEHPKQFQKETVKNQMYRSQFFYDSILKLSNVHFINYEISSQDILSNHNIEGVSTIKGNILLEAILNEIPAFYFGNTIWNKLENVFDCKKLENIDNINNLLKSKISFDNEKLKNSFYLCLKNSFLSKNSIHDNYNENDQKEFNSYIFSLL